MNHEEHEGSATKITKKHKEKAEIKVVLNWLEERKQKVPAK